ncbi:FAD-binding oxidoreductase [Streptomyces sp. WAC05374]|uniref:NAD(P)/FAD-dependent oxidoreductase n=1 Tax=Streptomyces sp. WAC05374 TaxID=2487420 RepID=UPI000F88BDCE|nr:FAD-dependent oxidoreductase [Streptomyces sp. WAC05374]RST19071.1 FAD-binding oxidoreductase [Streptomyces sp. WAC05374]TDF36961.1 FAD-binding oxidoreductase [Streptomyces sp. WAC05374]TDF46456.1 FAD-binding oxidoreductase [Streptomyces sp. WAC05374]TDF47557.1 FAD-binding oxidoreductase [Streptomyces sp. WAC05374]
MARPTDTDVAVVGAGVLGCVIAHRILEEAPGTRVTVLDRDMIASGATRRSAGLHFPRGASARVRAMASASQRYYAALQARRPGLPITSVGMTVVARRSSADQVARAYLPEARLRPAGAVPGGIARVPDGHAAWDGDGCQYADVAALTQALALDLRSRADFREATPVTGIEPGADEVRLALGTGDTLAAGRVVLAPGPWLDEPAWADLVRPLGARVKKIVALHIERTPAPDAPVVVFHDEDAFLLPLHHRGHWLFSYTCQEWDVTPRDAGPGLSPAHRAEALEVLGRYAPELAGERVSGRVFCDAYGPEFAPLVEPVTDDGRVVFAGAASGSGYRLAPAVAGDVLAALALPSPAAASTARLPEGTLT